MGGSSSKILCSALMLRHTLVRVARGSVDARALPTAPQCAQLLTLWLFPWRAFRGSPLARCAFLFWLQYAGKFFPELAIFTFIAGNLSGFFQRRLGRWAALLPPFISGSITFFMHEAPWLISSSYLTLLRGVSGASRPVLDWQNSPLHTCDPLATSKSSARADIETNDTPSVRSSWRELFDFWFKGFKHAFKLFVVGYLVIKPILRRRLPTASQGALAVVRSSAWVSVAGFIVCVCGWLDIPRRPVLTSALRILLSGAASCIVQVEGPEELSAVVSFMLGQALLVAAAAAQRGVWHAVHLIEHAAVKPHDDALPTAELRTTPSGVAIAHAISVATATASKAGLKSPLARALYAVSDVQHLISTWLPVLQMWQPHRRTSVRAAADTLSAWHDFRQVFVAKSALVKLVEACTLK